jgi:hypothetical protein
MTIFNGKYSWDGTKKNKREPIAWFPGSYDLKIFSIGDDKGGVKHLKQYACIYSKTGDGLSISENPEKFARQVCDDFSLDLEKGLWVEDLLCEKDRYIIVMFSRCRRLGDTIIYTTSKRKPFNAEKRWIKEALAKLSPADSR